MLQRSILVALVVTVAGLGLGCGGATGYTNCIATCDSGERCNVLTQGQALDCRNSCNGRKGALSDQDARDDANCKNAPSQRQSLANCLQQACNTIFSCIGKIDSTCVK